MLFSATGRWILKLWTKPAPSMLVGRDVGFKGFLFVAAPEENGTMMSTHHHQLCTFQADVRHAAPGSMTTTFVTGVTATVPCDEY